MKTFALGLLLLAHGLAWAQAVDPGLRQLPMNTAAVHPPTAALPAYPLQPAELMVNSRFVNELDGNWNSDKGDLRLLEQDSGRAMRVASTATQKLPADALIAGRAYVLNLKVAAGKAATLVARFREPKQGLAFRTFSKAITQPGDYRLEFTAPAYAAMAEIALYTKGGAPLTVSSVSLQMRAPIAASEAVKVEDWDHSYTPPGYALVFNDEFNGSELNRSKWFTRLISNGPEGGGTLDRLNDEKQRYADKDNHVEADGILHLVARRLPTDQPGGLNYQSGMIRSDWTLRYGFLEARVKMPGGKGVWPAFWLTSDADDTGRISWPPEIDVFEFVNNVENDKVNKIHIAANLPKGTAPVWLYKDPGFKPLVHDWVAPFDFDKGWHTIAIEWTPERLSWYVDGLSIMSRVYAWEYSDGVLAAPGHIMLNLAIGGHWAGRFGIDDSAFPQSLDIDWVRVYQKPQSR